MTDFKICSVTGHRPMGFPWDYKDKKCSAHKDYLQTMENLITKYITEKGYNYFIAGGAIGVDTDFAETVLRLRDTKFPHIKLEIAVPCENQELKWNEADKKKYHKILDRADFVNVLSKGYTRFCMQKRNEYMVNKSSMVFAFWNGEKKGGTWNTIHYMERKKHDFELIRLEGFTDEVKSVEAFLYSLIEGDTAKSKELLDKIKK